MRKTLLSVAAASAAALLAFSGCGSSGSGSASTPAGDPTLTVYTSMGYGKQVTEAFTKATGIKVNLVADSGGPLLTKVSAEKNNPQWGVLWVEGDTAFASLDKQGQLLPYEAKANWTDVGTSILPKNHSYTPTSVTVMAGLLCNKVKVPQFPSSYNDLLDPLWKDQIGMNDPAQSGPTYPFIAGLMEQMGGEQQGKDYFTKLKSNGLKVFPTNGDTVHALETGQISCGLVQSSAATGEILKTKANDTFKPEVTYLPKSTLLPGVIGIDKKANPAQQDSAKKFIDYIFTTEGQNTITNALPQGASLNWPIVKEGHKLDTLPDFPQDYQHIDPYVWGPKQPDIVTWFENNIK